MPPAGYDPNNVKCPDCGHKVKVDWNGCGICHNCRYERWLKEIGGRVIKD